MPAMYSKPPPISFTELAETAKQTQVGGSHYKKFPIQPIEFIQANHLGFVQGNVIKYACRAGLKGDGAEAAIEDWQKVIHYAQLEIEHLQNGAQLEFKSEQNK